MGLGLIALFIAVFGAGWLLMRVARGGMSAEENRTMTILKVVIWLGLIAALLAIRLWPLAFMVLIAAVAVTLIEQWRARSIGEARPPAERAPARVMTAEEAASVLGVGLDADAEEIRAAHRRLIAQIHPDKGGTDYLAAKINEARDYLLALRGEG